jgi:hypothetical protein
MSLKRPENECSDPDCPFHGSLAVRGRLLDGVGPVAGDAIRSFSRGFQGFSMAALQEIFQNPGVAFPAEFRNLGRFGGSHISSLRGHGIFSIVGVTPVAVMARNSILGCQLVSHFRKRRPETSCLTGHQCCGIPPGSQRALGSFQPA